MLVFIVFAQFAPTSASEGKFKITLNLHMTSDVCIWLYNMDVSKIFSSLLHGRIGVNKKHGAAGLYTRTFVFCKNAERKYFRYEFLKQWYWWKSFYMKSFSIIFHSPTEHREIAFPLVFDVVIQCVEQWIDRSEI